MADAEKKTPGNEAKAVKKAKKAEKPKEGKRRNYKLPTGVYRFSRNRMIKKRALYRYMNQERKVEPKKRKSRPKRYIIKKIGGEKNGGTRRIRVKKLPKYYPTESRPRKPFTRKTFFCDHKRKLRKSITPGTVLILVAGRHRGKRVVFLKQLKSGLLLVTGPFKLNACPLRRINQIYVIATKTKLDISKVELPLRLSDGYFWRRHPKKPKKDEGEIFEAKKEVYKVSARRKEDQITVDKQILDVIRQHPDRKMMFRYFMSQFCLRNKMYPHKMRF